MTPNGPFAAPGGTPVPGNASVRAAYRVSGLSSLSAEAAPYVCVDTKKKNSGFILLGHGLCGRAALRVLELEVIQLNDSELLRLVTVTVDARAGTIVHSIRSCATVITDMIAAILGGSG